MKTHRILQQLLPVCGMFLLLAAPLLRAEEHTDVVLDPAEGKIEKDTVFSVSFPGAMVPAGAVSAGKAASPVVIQPNLEGTFLWKSVSDGEFTVTGPLVPSTHYRVSLASGLKDADGRSIPAQKWEFDSDPFQVTSDDENRESLSVRPHFALHANYPVSLLDAAEAVYFQDRDSHERLPSEILIDNDQSVIQETDFTVVPRKPLPMGHTYDIVVNGLRDTYSHTQLAYMHVFSAGVTSPIEVSWVGAFNNPLEKPMIRMKFSEHIDPESVAPDSVAITPSVTGLKLHADEDEVIAEGEFDTRQHYTVVISPAVKGIRGFGLRQPSKWGATFHPKDADIIFPNVDVYQRSITGLRFSFLQVNTGPLSWTLSEVPMDQLPAVSERLKGYKTGETPLPLKVVTQGQFEANNGVEEVLREISWKPPQPLNGAYLLEATAADTDGDKHGNRALVCFSEYMLTQKRTDDQITLRVAKMSDGLGAPNLPVRVLTQSNLELARGVTDARGIVVFPTDKFFAQKSPNAELFVADTPTGPAIQYINGTTLSSAEYHRQESSTNLRSLIITDRNLYRPGQTVKLHGMIRLESNGQLAVPKFKEAEWKVKTDGGDPVTGGKVSLSSHGTWDAEWVIPSTQTTGAYNLQCVAGDLTSASTEIRVEEYRVPLFSVVVDGDETPGPASEVDVSSAYFHGAPNASAKVHWKALWSAVSFVEDRDDGFVHSDAYSQNRLENDEEKEAEGDAELDENGTVHLRCEPPFNDGRKRGRCTVQWTVDVTSAEAQTLTGGTECRVQAAKAWAGVRARTKTGFDRTVEIECEAIDLNDKPVKGATVNVELFHVATKTVREKIAPFVVRYRNTSEFEKVTSRMVATPAKLDFKVEKTGQYVAVVTGPGDVPVSTTTTVSGEEQAELPVENDTEIGVSLPEPAHAYKPGEVAPLSVQAPFGGIAWVSVEAGEILDTLLVPMAGNAGRIDLPIKKEYAPNATVTVYLIQPGGKTQLPRERLGEVQLEVDRPDQELAVTPSLAAPSVKPGAPVHGEFTVTSEGKPVSGADFLVFAVDDAVLKLGGWEMPDCKTAFYPDRDHGVSTYAALTHFLEKIDRRSLQEKGYIIGDGGEQAGNIQFVRKEFKTLAYWQSNLTTDVKGKISFDFTAPDNLTSYRVIAIGQTDAGQFGGGDATFTVSKPLLCEPALPRFVRVGDEVMLRAVARQKAAKSAKITVRCITEGLDLENPQPATADAPQDIPAIFTFPAKVREDSSGIKVRFEATSDIGESDIVETSLSVQPPTILRHETVATTIHGATFKPAEIAPKLWQGGRGAYDVTLSTSPWLPKLNGLPTILEYPHGCFEQISSRILAYAMMADLLSNLPDFEARDANYRATIADGLKHYENSLLTDGMLPYWPGSEAPNSFVTVLASWAIREATKAGIEVPGKLADELDGALQKIVEGNSTSIHTDALTRCLALMVSAGPDAPAGNANVAEDLYLKRDRLNDEGRALLAIAMHRLKAYPKDEAQLLREISKPITERAFNPTTFGSTTRAEALITLAFAECDPKSSQLKQRNDRLLKLLDSSAALSTQENLWLLLAFKAMHDARESIPLKPDSLAPAPGLVSKNHTGMAWTKNDLAMLNSFAINGLPATTPLTCLVSAEYRTQNPDTDRSDRGLRIERVVLDLTDEKRLGTAEAPFKLGDQLLVTYRLLSRDVQNYVALEDLLPAGLETVNPNLPLIAKTYQLPAQPGGRELELSHSELRDHETCLYFDRVDPGTAVYSVLARATSAGTYHWPATQVVPMYDSRFSGLSASASCVVSE